MKMQQQDKIVVGIVGCGSHCIHAHAESLTRRTDVSVGYAYDPKPSSISTLNALVPVQPAESEAQLLSNRMDAVFIMSPDEYHAQSLQQAIRARKHVFVEKPLAVTREQLQIVKTALEEAAQHGLIVSSCHPRRYDPPFMWIKDSLPALVRQFGSVQVMEFDFSYHVPSRSWKHKRGLLIDHANHEIDLVNWLLGSAPFRAFKLLDTPLAYQVTGVRKDGIRFSFNGTRLLDTSVFREALRVRFDKGEITLLSTEGLVRITDHQTGKTMEHSVPATDYALRSKRVNDNFIEAIAGNQPCYLSHNDLYTNTAFGVMLTEGNYWENY